MTTFGHSSDGNLEFFTGVFQDSEFDKAYNEIDKANNRKLLEEFETKSEIVSRPDSISEPMGLAASQSRPQK